MRTLTCDPETQVIGQTMRSFLENLRAEDVQPILQKHGLLDIQPDQWCPAQAFMDVMNDLAQESDLTSNLVAIGMSTIQHAVVPPQLAEAPFTKVLESWNTLYARQHRGGNIGGNVIEKVSDQQYKITLGNIYPDDFTYGVLYGMAKRWLPQGTHFKLHYDQGNPRRDEGGVTTILHISW